VEGEGGRGVYLLTRIPLKPPDKWGVCLNWWGSGRGAVSGKTAANAAVWKRERERGTEGKREGEGERKVRGEGERERGRERERERERERRMWCLMPRSIVGQDLGIYRGVAKLNRDPLVLSCR